jgi:hypothetical protein
MIVTFSISASDNGVYPYCYNLVSIIRRACCLVADAGKGEISHSSSARGSIIWKRKSASKLLGFSLVIGSLGKSGASR